MRFAWALPGLLYASVACATGPLSGPEAAAWLQRMADASRNLPYEGIFVMQQGDHMRSLKVENHPAKSGKESRLVVLDGQPREVFCAGKESFLQSYTGRDSRMQKRMGNRHFPDLLPENAETLANWYSVRLGEVTRAGGQECREVELQPKDRFRWGYVLCADSATSLPLRAAVVDHRGRPLVQYTFVTVKQEVPAGRPMQMPAIEEVPPVRMVDNSTVEVKKLPAGYAKVAAIRRTFPNRPGEVEHWIFSDGLTFISLFVEPNPRHRASIRGESRHGMVNLLTRKVGGQQVTVLGDAPWEAVEYIAMGVTEK